ncbi:MAG: TIGR00730 family Rossman fold protein [Chloroflexota bacterium]
MNICVYCSASDKIAAGYFALAVELGTEIARRGDTLVYGGSSAGLMGELAKTVQANGAKVIGVIPQALVDLEVAYHNADELFITANMRERKAGMEARSDAFVALPGGVGTLEEVFEIMAARSLGIVRKPLVMLNHEQFYDPLIHLLEHMHQANFLRAGYESMVYFAPTVKVALDYVDGYLASSSADN